MEEDLARAESLAFPILFVVSLFVFRGLVAALLPLVVGMSAILLTFLAMRVVNSVEPMSIFALNLIIGLGLGLAIDYSLFMVSRFREELERTHDTRAGARGHDAHRRAHGAVLGRDRRRRAVLAARVPAALPLLHGHRRRARGARRRARRAHPAARPARGARAARERPEPAPLAGGAAARRRARAVGLLVPPLAGGDAPARRRGREHGGAAHPARPAVHRRPLHRRRRLRAAHRALRARGRRRAAGGVPASTAARRCWSPSARPRRPAPSSRPTRSGSAAWRAWRRSARPRGRASMWRIDVVAPGGRLDERVQEAVRDVRAVPAPYPVLVGGSTAEFLDQQAALADGLPRALAWLTLTTLVILFLMTGSVVLPVKTLIMNLLTVSAAFGLLVLIFQDGRLEGLLAYTSQGALESSQPILLFAIAFGLSTDYGVFLLTRIKEARDGGLPNDEAVAVGLERTGRIVTAAALLLVIAIGAFATSEIVFIKELGVGTAARRDHRRHDRPRAARAVADEAAGRVELVGAAAAGAAARPDRPARGGGVTAAAAVHAFDADTALEPVEEGRWRATCRPTGSSPAAPTAASSRPSPPARRRRPPARPLRSLALHFLAAPAAGPLDVRRGRARRAHDLGRVPRLEQEGRAQALALATLSALPERGLAWDVAEMPAARPPPSTPPMPRDAAGAPPSWRTTTCAGRCPGGGQGGRRRAAGCARRRRARSTRRSWRP